MMKRKPKSKKFDELMYQAVYATVREALESILKAEYKIPSSDKDKPAAIDYERTCSEMKTRARVALELVSNIEIKNENKK